AKLQHPNIVGVHQVFEDNETSYMALDFVRGRDLLDVIEEEPHLLGAEQIKSILMKMLSAVGYIHDRGILHRDISPDNILLDEWGNPVLIDFGAAREEATRVSRVLSAQNTVKDGYSPQEFYIAGSKQTLSSDLYALAATFYHMISGDPPPVSQLRLSAVAEGKPDPYVPLLGRMKEYDRFFLGAIDKCLSVFPADRLQTAHEWLDEIDEPRRRKLALQKAQKDEAMEQTIFALVEQTNKEVVAEPEPETVQKAVPSPAPIPAHEIASETLKPRTPFPELRDNPTVILSKPDGNKSFFERLIASPFRRRSRRTKPQSDIVGKADQ
ncbi:MAG: serine/threonine protein kinase, partial [Alphaproteobacteria bacterium]|nr:serine/threonine protein kinase [Alphaproteobacteria bacterium]